MEISQEQIEQANQTDLTEFLRSQGEELRQEGKNFRWLKHDSVMISGNRWIQNSTKKKGYPIHFVETFYDMSFRDAVFFLIGNGIQLSPLPAEMTQKKQFRLPDRDLNNNSVIQYLAGRGISPAVIQQFIDMGVLYQEAGRFPNAVFVGRSPDGVPKYCFKRGTKDYVDREGRKHRFCNEPEGSDKRFSFCKSGSNNKLCLFESCIDLLSFMTLFQFGDCHLLSLGGTGDEALRQYLSDHPSINCVIFCLDNDPAGKAAADRLGRILPSDFTVGRMIPTHFKDWNEALMHYGETADLYDFEQNSNR